MAREMAKISEGSAEILPINGNAVFYNNAQVFNRDMSVLAINTYYNHTINKSSKLTILEGLAASGLRSVRYCKEIHGVEKVVANDLSSDAVSHIAQNRSHNDISENLLHISQSDACAAMYSNVNTYNVIDLDPYGSVSPFVDAAVKSVVNGGLLCITSTDSAVLCGNQPDVCYARYGGTPLKVKYCHEMSIRLLLHCISTSAARYRRSIIPLACFNINFYYRCFIQVVDSPAGANNALGKTSLVLQCCMCDSFELLPLGHVPSDSKSGSFKPGRLNGLSSNCQQCGSSSISIGGPFWSDPIYQPDFLQACITASEETPELFPYITSWPKLSGLLHGLKLELEKIPFFYTLPGLLSLFKLNAIKLEIFKRQLRILGFQVSHSHTEPNALKTDAPSFVLFDLMRLLVKFQSPKNSPKLKTLMDVEIKLKESEIEKIDFRTDHIDGDEILKRIPVFIPNPEKNWGPKKRANIGSNSTNKKQNVSNE